MRRLLLPLALCAGALALAGAPLVATYADGPPAAHTGGFGERTCAACHFGEPENDAAGSLALRGVPERYVPGERYPLTVVLRRPGMQRGGFELAARFAARPREGRQAGTLEAPDERARVTRSGEPGIDYAHHTRPGSAAADSAVWRVLWTAPAPAGGPVVFHLAGNAADGDESQFGDHVYTATATAR